MTNTDLHVRLPENLKAALEAEAARLGISLNATVVIALRHWQASK